MPEQQQITLESVKNYIKELTPKKDLLYIIQPCSVGDFFYTGGLSLAVQKRKNKRATVLIVKDRMKNLGVTYKNFEDIVYIPNDTMNIVMQYFYVSGDYEGDNYIYGHFHKPTQGGNFIWDETLHLIDRYKKDVFKIPMDTPYAKPVVPKISNENIAELHEKYIIDKNRTIIITPYTHSTKQLDMRFWMFLSMVLMEKNYIVYTNVDGISEQAVPGTAPITTNMRELYYIADKVNCFIGGRVGIFDFLAMTDARTFTINTFPDWLWDVSELYPHFNNHSFFNAIDYVQPATNYFKEKDVSAQIKLSHSHIKNEDIVYSYEEIFNKVLNGVININ
ncbi:MAG: hypothetical protein IKZ58_04810 [Selenomonadaceae bacterium]|nr:hypothetical protein [Selenomonadaceae bacterium]